MGCEGGEVTEEERKHLKFLERTCQYPPRLQIYFEPEKDCGKEFVTVRFTNVEHSFLVLLKQQGIHCIYILYTLPYICIGTDAIDTSLCKPPPSINHEPSLSKGIALIVIFNGTYTHYRY